MPAPLRLGVNIDHVATLRNARGGPLPDTVRAAQAAIAAGADSITVHLREDRRHITDEDVRRLRAEIAAPLNVEMAATDEMLAIALATQPHATCIVPEKRTERTTEGGLDVASARDGIRKVVRRLAAAGIRVSLFINSEARQVEAAAALGAHAVELHTGTWCDGVAHGHADAELEFDRLQAAAKQAATLGLEVHAGHGLDYATAETIAAIGEIVELNIGHFLVGEAVFVGLESAVRSMRAAMARGRKRVGERAA